jgi:membrane-associated phospholipid phosphatase
MQFLTDFADQAVILPLSVVIGLVFLAVGWLRGAFAWSFAICGTLATMLALKLCMLACGWRWPILAIQSPSGHTASAAVVYGGLLSLALPRAPLAIRILLILAPAGLFGFTRLALHAHTLDEVISGGTVGLVGALVMKQLAGERPQTLPPRRLRVLIGAAALFVVFALHGKHMPAEISIRRLTFTMWPISACRMQA